MLGILKFDRQRNDIDKSKFNKLGTFIKKKVLISAQRLALLYKQNNTANEEDFKSVWKISWKLPGRQ